VRFNDENEYNIPVAVYILAAWYKSYWPAWINISMASGAALVCYFYVSSLLLLATKTARAKVSGWDFGCVTERPKRTL
jgi:hypothetical protein